MPNEIESENQKLKATLIDCRAEYLLFLDENPNSFAWDFDELSRETQDRYRKDARESLEIEEPVIAIQLREAEAKIAELEADLEKEEHNSEAFMNKIGEQVCYIVDLENQVADLEKRNEDLTHRLGKEQVVAMQDRETQLQKYIRELEARVKALKEIAESQRPVRALNK